MKVVSALAVLLFLLGTSGLPATETAIKKQPNVIVIMADDLGYGDVSCYGATALQTPNIDRLGGRGAAIHQRLLLRVDLHADAVFAADRQLCVSQPSGPGSLHPMRRPSSSREPKPSRRSSSEPVTRRP